MGDSIGLLVYCLCASIAISICDIDECYGPNNCSENATCVNNSGSYSCVCDTGFMISGDGITCVDIDECIKGVNCTEGGNCIDDEDYSGSGNECDDMDDCAEVCSGNATCVNTPGTYTCTCDDGYAWDGVTCVDVDECMMTGHCHDNATCTSMQGGFHCQCIHGFVGDGFECQDINECSLSNKTCNMTEQCINTIGSYICAERNIQLLHPEYPSLFLVIGASFAAMLACTILVAALIAITRKGKTRMSSSVSKDELYKSDIEPQSNNISRVENGTDFGDGDGKSDKGKEMEMNGRIEQESEIVMQTRL